MSGTKQRKIENNNANQQSLFKFFGRTQKDPMKKMEKTPENSMTIKHLCKPNEFVKIYKE